MECAAHVAGIAIWEIGALNHQEVGDAFLWINPGLSAPSAAVTEAASREDFGCAFVGFFQDAGAEAPTIITTAVTIRVVLKKSRLKSRRFAGC